MLIVTEELKLISGHLILMLIFRKISKLRITDYNLKDTVSNSPEVVKGMIAQEVKDVMPNAVRSITNVVPDIFCLADKVQILESDLQLKLPSSFDLKLDDKIRIISVHGTEELFVKEIEGDIIKLANTKFKYSKEDKVFVYGREVNDFLSIDFNQITALNTSAIQSLIRENSALNQKLKTVEASVESV
jgi:hypothetical protein